MLIKNAVNCRDTKLLLQALHRFLHCLLLHCSSVIFVAMLIISTCVQATDKNTQLESIRQSIAEKEDSIQQRKKQQNELQSQLKQQENTIAYASHRLFEINSTLTQLDKDVASLAHLIQQLQARQVVQQEVLARQLNAAFRQGRYNGWQLMLDAQASQRRERMLVWLSYLNQTRYHAIEKIKQTRTELAMQQEAQQQKQKQQKVLLTEQRTQKGQLESAHTERRKTLVSLETELKKDQLTLAQLKENEMGLRDKILRAEREAKARAKAEHEARIRAEREAQRQAEEEDSAVARSDSPQAQKPVANYTADAGERMTQYGGLGKPNRQAVWPLRGSVLHHFGEKMQGELRWKGMVISAPEGAKVKAIADGTVLLTDWLQGYGFVVVLEHGVNDMSVYGYNQNALVEVGASVKAGQPIALVGDSGGQGYPALYLEIRHQGQAVNPEPWLGK